MRNVLDAIANAILIVRKGTGKIAYANPSSGKLVGMPFESIRGTPLTEILPSAPRERTGKPDGNRVPENTCFEITRTDGAVVTVTMKSIPYRWEGEEQELIVLTDMTEQLELEKQFLLSNEKLKKWVVETEQRNRELAVLQELTILLQRSRNLDEVGKVASSWITKVLPKSLGDLVLMESGRKEARTVSAWGGIPAGPDPLEVERCAGLRTGKTAVVRSDDSDGPSCARHVPGRFRASFCVPLEIDGEAMGAFHVHFNRTHSTSQDTGEDNSLEHERKLAESAASLLSLSIANARLRESLLQQAIRDPLTGLFNRRYFDESIAREVARAFRAKKPLSIVMADIDHFKKFNDRFGHAAGDEVLKAVSRCIKSSVRASDIVCRYGGEEFIVALQDANLPDAVNRAEQIRKTISSTPLDFEGKTLGHVTMSFGVSEYPIHGEQPERFIKEADMALYEAKKEGRNRVIAASSPGAPVGSPAHP